MDNSLYRAEEMFDIPEIPEDSFDVAEASFKPDDIIKIYQSQIEKIPIPDPIEIKQLSELIQNGKNAEETLQMLDFAEIPREGEILQIEAIAEAGKIAKERLVIGHLRFAAHVARLTMGWVPYGYDEFKSGGESIFNGARIKNLARFASSPLPLADRIQRANIGLIKAARNYKAEGGATFTTYSMYSIEHEIERAIAYDRNIKIPINVLGALAQTAIKPDTLQISTFPSIKVIGLGQEHPKVKRRYIEEISTPISLDELQDQSRITSEDNDDVPTFYETVDERRHHPFTIDIDEEVNKNLRDAATREALATMPERERRIIELRFGFEGVPWTMEEVGQELDVTRERVGQLESQALRRLSGLRILQGAVF